MAFLKRKGVKFSVDMQVCNLSDVPLVNATVFAKIRLLDGGSFEDTTERVEVMNHSAAWAHRSVFLCRIPCEPTTGMLEKCLCRISIRKEQKGGKTFCKLGYVDVNLSEFAGSGVEGIVKSYLLNGYTSNQRLDNSKVVIKLTLTHQSSDPFFRVPRIAQVAGIQEGQLDPEESRACDPEVPDQVPPSNAVVVRRGVVDECRSMSGSYHADVEGDRRTIASNAQNNSASNSLRRYSQDRSAQYIQSTRVDANSVIDSVIAECQMSGQDFEEPPEGDLTLFVDKDGRPSVGPAPSKNRSSVL